MYKREFDSLIASKKAPNFFLIRGNDEFLNAFCAKQLLNLWNSENVLEQYFEEYNFNEAMSFLEPSLFGDKNIIYIKNDKTTSTKEIKEIIEKCKKDENNYVLYEIYECGNRLNNDFLKAFGTNFLRVFKPNSQNEALQILTQISQILKLFPNSLALLEIYKIHNENLSLCVAELKKFKSLNLELNLENVKENVSGLSEVSFEDLFEKIISLKDFRDDFFTYTQSGSYNESELINYFYSSIFRIFSIHTFIKINGKIDFKEVLGYLPPIQIQNNLKTLALQFSTEKFKEMFISLNKTEYSLKTKTNINKTYLLLSGLLEFQRILSKK
ncbi:DNA polymerase III, delta subunit [Campylobacter ureolyticus RIGS 9880]|uniref:DNA polymerase III, delta subunit n=1 Tax=Campylobacter ureolyticus RIGS 9880 TaxID=1032069 RepID=A0AAU8U0I1_9BACT|nr:DNA polymerase III subunit delta [Campylobacter ureolyticus]AKT90688.1 DNA polymerase III, delta subunit [Campylobacter ureolyticus RIGS 9880]